MNNKSNTCKKVKKGDQVVAISGNHRGQVGKVLSRIGDKVIVQGLNLRKKHVKKSQANPQGSIIELERPIHISNVRACTADGQKLNLKTRVNAKGHRELFYKEGDKDMVYREIKKS